MKILNFASLLSLQNSDLCKRFSDDEILTISAMQDEQIGGEFVKCEIGACSYVLASLCANICDDEYFADLDSGYLNGESNVGDEEIEEILEFLDGCEIFIADDAMLKSHPDSVNIETFIAILQEKFGFKILNLNGDEISLNKHELSPLQELSNFDGAVVFKHNVDDKFIGGKYFCVVAKISDGDEVVIKTENLNIQKKFILDEKLKGTVAILGLKGCEKCDGYDFETAKICKV